jgi:hypothetical protein
MKRFTTLAGMFSVSILAVWAISQIFAASQHQAKNDNASIKVPPAHNEIMEAVDSGNRAIIPVTGAEARRIAPVFDANGSVVSDPSGVIWNARPSEDMRIAPVFDSNGAVVSDPSGTLGGAGNMATSATGADRSVAPVFDANGSVVSDPSGAILNANQP